jgi:paraquat-inducible protein A
MDLTRRSIFLEMLMAFAALTLLFGLTKPVVQLTWLYVFSNAHSIVSVIWVLWSDKEWLLAGVLTLFSIVFPVAKLGFLLALYIRRLELILPGKRALTILGLLGRWSMLDVLVLALVVFYAKQQGIANAMEMPGIWLFTLSVLLTMWASERADQEFEALRQMDAERDAREKAGMRPRLTLVDNEPPRPGE